MLQPPREVTPYTELDRAAWAQLRASLWPDASVESHAVEIERLLGSNEYFGFLAETDRGIPAGFAEVAIRRYANGCESQPVPFLEGIFVAARFRRRGVGRRLIEHIAACFAARGFREIGSDALLDNRASHAAHAGWGFCETERVVYFRKPLVTRGR